MNILHHKSWHVRNRDNIERVRKDEAKAAEEEKQIEQRAALAESEARTTYLRQQAKKRRRSDSDEGDGQVALGAGDQGEKDTQLATTSRHINFFNEEEAKRSGTNAEYEAEKKAEQEKQEKAIGLLTYLGQGSIETQETKPWYYHPPEKRQKLDDSTNMAAALKRDFDLKSKRSLDPMDTVTRYLSVTEKVHARDQAAATKASRVLAKSPTAPHTDCKVPSTDRGVPEKERSSLTTPVLAKKAKKKKHKEKEQHKKHKKHKHKKKSKKKHKRSDSSSPEPTAPKQVFPISVSGESSSGTPSETRLAEPSLNALRAERHKREKQERQRREQLLAKAHGTVEAKEEPEPEPRGYNSQYNPELARRRKSRTER